ncbi:MAG: hypothetical protein NVSMB46_03570 [Candidatus Saccharimonadales bacterium]
MESNNEQPVSSRLEQSEQLRWDTSSWVTNAELEAMSDHPVSFTNAQLRRALVELQARRSLDHQSAPSNEVENADALEDLQHALVIEDSDRIEAARTRLRDIDQQFIGKKDFVEVHFPGGGIVEVRREQSDTAIIALENAYENPQTRSGDV